MLALAAAQLLSKAEKQDASAGSKRIWVDVGFPTDSELYRTSLT